MGIISFINKVCVQTAVYWGNPVPNGTGGYVFDDPIEIKCRWDDVAELFVDNTGNEIVSKAQVMIPQSYSIQNEGWLYLGDLDDSGLDSTTDPIAFEGAFPIRRIDKVPLFASTSNFVITAYLSPGGIKR